MDRQNKNAVVLESVIERRIMLELVKKRKRHWLGHCLKRYCLLKDALESRRNGKREEGSRQKKISDDRQHHENGLYEDTKRKAEKRVEWRMMSLQ